MLHRITLTAQRLTDDRGLDGFTMEDLAAAVDVSRRTLFNYYPSKIDAVLGPDPDLDDEVWATFVAGGPHGDLVEDIIALSCHVLQAKPLTREELALDRRIMLAEPRLLAAVHDRLATVSAELGALLVARTGDKLDLATAQLLVRVLAATFDCAMDRALSVDDVADDVVRSWWPRTSAPCATSSPAPTPPEPRLTAPLPARPSTPALPRALPRAPRAPRAPPAPTPTRTSRPPPKPRPSPALSPHQESPWPPCSTASVARRFAAGPSSSRSGWSR